jgi:uncharacterized protein YndB with AHSA1/START domain
MTETKMAETTDYIYEIDIKTTPEKLWQALTDGQLTPNYYYGSRVESDWKQGSKYEYIGAEHKPGSETTPMISGEILEIDPPRKLVMTFNALWCESPDEFPASRVTYEIAQHGDLCKLSLVHDRLTPDSPSSAQISGGWPLIFGNLKTYLETGKPAETAEESE